MPYYIVLQRSSTLHEPAYELTKCTNYFRIQTHYSMQHTRCFMYKPHYSMH